MASAGSVVPFAYAAGSWTVPSHAAMLSGLLPRAAGISRVSQSDPMALTHRWHALRERLLAEVMRAAGYETRAISTNGWLIPGGGVDAGFERFELIDPPRDQRFAQPGRRGAAVAMREGLFARADDGAQISGELLSSWISEQRDRPFMWFVNLVEAHSPYLPPKPFNPLGPAARTRAALEARRYLSLSAIWKASLGQLEVPADILQRMRALYAGAIRLLDAWLAELLERLDQAGILDDTLVIVTADHGENLGEQGMMGHCFSLDERLLRVPYVAQGPSLPSTGELLSLADLPKLLGDALDIDHPWERNAPTGIAIAQFDPPTDLRDPHNDTLLDIWEIRDGRDALERRFTSSMTCATDGRLKVLSREDHEEVFDLTSDALEERPLAVEGIPPRADDLRDALAAADRQSESSPSEGHGQHPSHAPAPDDLEERMRLLGYL